MKYFLIAGEASGDLHAANLMKQLKKLDKEADFRFFGGDLMKEQGGVLIRHYKELAYMGFIAVIKNAGKIWENLNVCKREIQQWNPDIVILIDYPGFNLKIARYVKESLNIPVHYYISPKLWAWKEYRIKSIKKYVDSMFTIFPFETEFYKKHDYNVTYVGNPVLDAIEFRSSKNQTKQEFLEKNKLSDKPIISLLAGSRKQEIANVLPIMLELIPFYKDFQFVIAGMEAMKSEYTETVGQTDVKIIYNQTYELLSQSTAALVTSGTATLETGILKIPQVVCYYLSGGKIAFSILEKIIKTKQVSLVNIISGKEVVKELIGPNFNLENLKRELDKILFDEQFRKKQIASYESMIKKLGSPGASRRAAIHIYHALTGD